MNIAINGFGRIGRNFLRAVLQDKQVIQKLIIKTINIGPAKKEMIAHMFKYDTLMGTYPGNVRLEKNMLHVDEYKIEIIAEKDPEQIDWSSRNIEWVVECSGCFIKRDGAQKHLTAGAQNVLISAPAKEEDVTIIQGVNDAMYKKEKHHIVSLGSCTTNAFLPMLHVLHNSVGIVNGGMTTVHAYTNTQVLLDVEAKDERRSRAAALNIIPTTTGAANLIERVIPSLKDCINAMAMRVPVGKVSLIDFSFIAKEVISRDYLNELFVKAAEGELKNILAVTHEPLVSSDFNGNPYSIVIDALSTQACGSLGKVLGWYDNEWAYSVRLKDFLLRDL